MRDLRIELTGRRGWVLPMIAAIILAPMASAPVVDARPVEAVALRVGGEPPAEVLAIERVEVDQDRAVLLFEPPSDANGHQWVLTGDYVPSELREALDGLGEGVQTEFLSRWDVPMPQRSLLLSLIAASILTGAISQSIPGERTAGTLETLLTASITKAELVTGKWLAWGGFGGGAALAAISVSLALGRQSLGWWVLPAPTVSLGTVALGFFMVRRANDVVGGATVAIRVLPAALTGMGLLAWYAGTYDPLYGAILPLGGALVAAGDTWPGAWPSLVATASTMGTSSVLIWLTARDLADHERLSDDMGLRAALGAASVAALGWWGGVCGSLIWTVGGNEDLSASLSRASGVITGVACLALLVAIRMGRSLRPLDAVGWQAPPRSAWPLVVVAGVALIALGPVSGLVPAPPDAIWLQLRIRLGAALQPGWVGPITLAAAVIAQESLFRGWLRSQVGDAGQLALFVLILTPLDPAWGLMVGGICTLLVAGAGGSIWPAVGARLVWGLVPSPNGSLPPWAAALAGLGVLWLLASGSGLIGTRPRAPIRPIAERRRGEP